MADDGFEAGRAVKPLKYNLEPYVEGCKGIIPEPTQEQVDDFVAATRRKTGGEGGEVREDERTEVGEALVAEEKAAAAGDSDAQRTRREYSSAVSDVCSGVITTDDLAVLPQRIRIAFFGWLWSELVDPTLQKAAMRR